MIAEGGDEGHAERARVRGELELPALLAPHGVGLAPCGLHGGAGIGDDRGRVDHLRCRAGRPRHRRLNERGSVEGAPGERTQLLKSRRELGGRSPARSLRVLHCELGPKHLVVGRKTHRDLSFEQHRVAAQRVDGFVTGALLRPCGERREVGGPGGERHLCPALLLDGGRRAQARTGGRELCITEPAVEQGRLDANERARDAAVRDPLVEARRAAEFALRGELRRVRSTRRTLAGGSTGRSEHRRLHGG